MPIFECKKINFIAHSWNFQEKYKLKNLTQHAILSITITYFYVLFYADNNY